VSALWSAGDCANIAAAETVQTAKLIVITSVLWDIWFLPLCVICCARPSTTHPRLRCRVYAVSGERFRGLHQRRDESPGTRGSWSGRSHCGQNMFGRSVPDCRWTDAWLSNVQSGNRQQATRLQCCRTSGRGRCTERVCGRSRYSARQKKTGRPVRFELTAQTRQAVDDYIKAAGQKPGKFLFSGRGDHNRCVTTQQYALLVSSWVATIGLDPHFFGTHSLRRTKATLIYRRTGNLRAVQLLLGHTKIESTVRYLGIEVDDALAIAEQVDVWTTGAKPNWLCPPSASPSCHFRTSSSASGIKPWRS